MRHVRLSRAAAGCAAVLALAAPAARAQQHQHPPAQPAPSHGEHAGHAAPAPAAADTGARAARPAPPRLRTEFAAGPAGAVGTRAPKEREEMEVRLRLADPATGRPLSGLQPMAWVDTHTEGGREVCQAKVGAFGEGNMQVKHGQISLATPVDDLNGHYLVALARTPAVVVVDPVKGFGRTKLFTAVPLKSPGEDWAATPDDRRLFVTQPGAGEVAVINTHSWRPEGALRVGSRPTRVAMHPHGRLLFVSADSAHVAVVDALTLQTRATLPVGAGPHVFAFSDDGRWALVASRAAGTVSVIDAASLRKTAEVATGRAPADVAWSPARRAAFVANEGDGVLAVVDPATGAVTDRVAMEPGIRSVRFAPDPAAAHGGHAGHGGGGPTPGGRLAFVLNPRGGSLVIYDAVDRKVIRTLSGAPEPDQVTFTGQFAYIRAAGTASVAMIPLSNPTAGAVGPHDYFPAGSTAPGSIAAQGLGDVLVAQPGMHDAVYVANPGERMVYSYHYMEGMPVPHGGLTTYGFEPKAIRTVSRRLRETEPGVYAATLRVERPGEYDLVLRNAEPYALECFPFTVAPDPTLRPAGAVRVVAAEDARTLKVGKAAVRFRVFDQQAGAPVEALEDFRVQLASTDGWQQRSMAKALGGGLYEAEFDVPAAGVYFAAFEIPSRGVGLRDGSPLSFQAGP